MSRAVVWLECLHHVWLNRVSLHHCGGNGLTCKLQPADTSTSTVETLETSSHWLTEGSTTSGEPASQGIHMEGIP